MWITGAMAALAVAGAAAHAAPPAYDDYRAALTAFVDSEGRVDYAGLKEQRRHIDNFVVYLERLSPETYNGWPHNDRIAFWINAYNALTLRAIIDNYPINPAIRNLTYPQNSIRQIHGVWDLNRVNVMGQSTTLQYIENKHLRRDFREPRVHMALVCAAVSCPKLRNEPYEGDQLEAQLDDQVRHFLSDPRHFRIDMPGRRVRASEIFRWYAEDFAPRGASLEDKKALEREALLTFTAPYLSNRERAVLAESVIEYAPYNWELNEQPR
jgi:hypothetical protein